MSPSGVPSAEDGAPPPRRAARVAGPAAGLVAAILALNYTLNHFYVRGAYMMDSGWFADLATQTSWPPPNPPAIADGTYFRYHLSPFFWLWAQPWGVLDAAGLAPPPAVWFSVSQALWFGALALGLALLVGPRVASLGTRGGWTAAVIGVLGAFCGASLAVLGFAHFEVATPAMAVLALAFVARDRWGAAGVALAVGVLTREDAGFHFLVLMGLLAGVAWLRRRRSDVWRGRAARLAVAAAACGMASVAAMVVQAVAFPSPESSFARIYSGAPAWAHVDAGFIADRLAFLAVERAALWVPFVTVAAVAVARRSALLVVGPLAAVPWLAVSIAAVATDAGHLTGHYAFPLVLTTVWPVVAWGLDPRDAPVAGASPVRPALAAAGVIVASIVLYPLGQGNHDRNPFRSAGPTWIADIGPRQDAARLMVAGPHPADVVDDAVASLMPRDVRPGQWRPGLAYSPQELAGVTSLGFAPTRSWIGAYARSVAEGARLTVACPVEGSGWMVARRAPIAPDCVPIRRTRSYVGGGPT